MSEGASGVDIVEPSPDNAGKPDPKPASASSTPAKGGEGDKAKPPAGYVPVSEVQKERNRSKTLQAQLEALQRGSDTKPKDDDDPAPNKFRDPAGYTAWVKRQAAKVSGETVKTAVAPVEARLQNQILRISEDRIRTKLKTPEKWSEFNDWLKEQPDDYKAAVRRSDDPYGVAYDDYRYHGTSSRLGDMDLDDFIEAEIERRSKAANGDDGGGLNGDDGDGETRKPSTPKPLAGARATAEPKQSASPPALSAILDKSKRKKAR